ncbi:MAG: MotA/TolQ/ExbB proton channel family protein [Porticoccus sp.]
MVMQVIDGAGWPIWLLIFTSIAGLSIILERAWFLREESVIPKILLSTSKAMVHKKHIDIEEIQKLCNKNYLGEIFLTILENQKSDVAVITAIVEQKAINIRYQLEKHLSYLTTVATVAPLLGLFGTIIGMVELFGSFTSGGSDVSAFAKGISIALYNTAGGILVAVPAMIAYRYFRTKVDHILNEMEVCSNELINLISSRRD